MKEAIKKFGEQFGWSPVLENAAHLKENTKFILVGMGGSNLSAGLLKAYDSTVDVVVHRDYGLPSFVNTKVKDRLVICSSYSGNTEEVIDAFNAAVSRKLPVAVISSGGKLIELAKEAKVPHVRMPDWGLEPRMAVGLNFMAMLKIMGKSDDLKEVSRLSSGLHPGDWEEDGRRLAKKLNGHVPVIYSSSRYSGVAYNWKIKFNETAKIPAFFNAFPEINHNEMIGFDARYSNKGLSDKFHFLILKDEDDNPKTLKRMDALKRLLEERSLPVDSLELSGRNDLEKIFNSIILADWTAYYTAEGYGIDPEDISLIEEFKQLIK